ncbi:MAG: hypothetical protein ACO3N4_06315 [Ilumatobacteraceae bacterium]
MRGWWFDVDGVAALRHQVARVDADLSVWCARVGDPMAGGLAMAVRSLRDRLRGDWVSMIDAVAASRLLDDWSPADAVLAMSAAAPEASSITDRLALAVTVAAPSLVVSLLDEAVAAANRPALLGGDDGRRLLVVDAMVRASAGREDVAVVAADLDADTVRFLMSERGLDAEAVERLIAARAAAEVSEVGVLAQVAADSGLSVGARRGAAAALVAHLDVLGPVIDREVVAVDSGGVTTVVTDAAGMRALLDEVLSDAPARFTFGVGIGSWRDRSIAEALAVRPSGEQTFSATLAAQLAPVDRAIDLVDSVRVESHLRGDLAHAVSVSRGRSATTWAASLASLVIPEARAVAWAGSAALHATFAAIPGPDRLDDEAFVERLRDAEVVSLLSAVAERPDLHGRLGLMSVPVAIWRRLGELVDEFVSAVSDSARRVAVSAIASLVATSTALSTFVTSAGADR